MSAKMIAKRYASDMCIVPRSTHDLLNMVTILQMKLQQHPALADLLKATGDATIIEDVSARRNESGLFWGAAPEPDGTWTGENRLGEMWMEIRSTLK